ncbi:unnamed protein product [Symbiodinium microadriaticum]|nr:unnamed protein product [Symbiodinium sp. KB8]CAE7240213.1 unnamed protein product [Symbiodinium microadriaticum]
MGTFIRSPPGVSNESTANTETAGQPWIEDWSVTHPVDPSRVAWTDTSGSWWQAEQWVSDGRWDQGGNDNANSWSDTGRDHGAWSQWNDGTSYYWSQTTTLDHGHGTWSQRQWDDGANQWDDSANQWDDGANQWDDGADQWDDGANQWDGGANQWDGGANRWSDDGYNWSRSERDTWSESQWTHGQFYY